MARSNRISKIVATTAGRKTRLQQHEPSANNGGSQMFPGLGKRIGGPLAPRKPKR